MVFSDLSGSVSPFSADGASAGPEPRPEARATRFQSVLFEQPQGGPGLGLQEPGFFVDLNLDQVLQSMLAGREQYELAPFFYAPLHEAAAVRYRHEVLRDLEKPEVLVSIRRFAEAMARMRGHLEQIERLHYELERQAWFLDAVEIYCEAVRWLSEELYEREVTSRGLCGLREYLAEYIASERFTALAAETQALQEALAGIRYTLRIEGAQVTVNRYDGDADYSAEVQETFARFRQAAVKSYLVEFADHVGMNHVEARILELVARRHADVFGRRADYCSRYADYLDATIARFDREVQFYVGYLELIGPFRAAGLPFCYPHVSAQTKEIAAAQSFDIALANKLVPEGRAVVCNDFHLQGHERILVISGPNNGGKTTFARSFGQLHYLASLGLLVPASAARLLLPDRIYTHFEKQEDIETLRGKFDDELVRVREILEQATSRSIIVMNESFNSTSLNDALFVGTEVLGRILALGPRGVYVTFVDELASLSDATVSMVTQIVPENPAERTFKVLRKPADGIAYAWAIAEKYRLTYERLMERIDE